VEIRGTRDHHFPALVGTNVFGQIGEYALKSLARGNCAICAIISASNVALLFGDRDRKSVV